MSGRRIRALDEEGRSRSIEAGGPARHGSGRPFSTEAMRQPGTLRYFSDLGPKDGAVRYPNDLDCLAVLAEEGGKQVFAGIAHPAGWRSDPVSRHRLALYRLVIRGVELEGRWLCTGREFTRAVD